MKTQWTLIFALLFALIIALFAVVNVAPVPVNFLFTKRQLPLILVVLGSTLLGGLIVGLFGIIRQYRLQRKIKNLQKQVDQLQTQIAEMPENRIQTAAGEPSDSMSSESVTPGTTSTSEENDSVQPEGGLSDGGSESDPADTNKTGRSED